MIDAHFIPDFASIAGQFQAKHALEIAACGGHSIALIGGPGNGKTLLAQALFGLLPALLHEQAGSILEGQEALNWIEEALDGKTGKLAFARHGALSLDRVDLLTLSPLQIERVATVFDRVRDVQLVLTAQPCPCGMHGDLQRECVCSAQLILRHWRRLQGLMERVAIVVEVPRFDFEQQVEQPIIEDSATVAARIRETAMHQWMRFAGLEVARNADMDHAQLLQCCRMEESAQLLYQTAYQQWHLSGRAADQVLAVARTIADVDSCEAILLPHMAEAIHLSISRLKR